MHIHICVEVWLVWYYVWRQGIEATTLANNCVTGKVTNSSLSVGLFPEVLLDHMQGHTHIRATPSHKPRAAHQINQYTMPIVCCVKVL